MRESEFLEFPQCAVLVCQFFREFDLRRIGGPHWGNYGNSLTNFWRKFRESNGFTKAK